jgi:urea transport system ATP-binding protein
MALLEISDLRVEFGGLTAVVSFDLSVNKGEILCLLGPNGAGKSTTLDLICGKTTPSGGSIVFDGTEVSGMLEFKRARLGIGRKFQVPTVFKELTVNENLRVARSNRYRIFETLKNFGGENSGKIENILDMIGLSERRHELAGNLSHGETQWLEIAMLIAQDSKLILMDEPTAGMTIQETQKTGEIFATLRKDHALIVVEHDMSFVRKVADRITVMAQGKKLAEGTVVEIENNEDVKSAYLGH